ncbi:MAG TPA: sugar phosphate nucleotidyltransferase, partial [Alphaproteobacteria bacterium]|nr:sugar phosphate nucleotidyltransferase [Alphaproteobacteria bacterium]
MKAVILAAGVSRRLYPMTYEMPKCLIEVGEKPILDHQLIALQSADVNDIVLVVGYYREAIINHVQTNFPDMNIEYVINHHYFETNTAYSLEL